MQKTDKQPNKMNSMCRISQCKIIISKHMYFNRNNSCSCQRSSFDSSNCTAFNAIHMQIIHIRKGHANTCTISKAILYMLYIPTLDSLSTSNFLVFSQLNYTQTKSQFQSTWQRANIKNTQVCTHDELILDTRR